MLTRGEVKQRKPLIAALLSLLTPGLGQMYNVQLRKGIVLFLADIIVPVFLVATPLLKHFYGAVAFVMIALLVPLLIIIDAFVAARRAKAAALRDYNRWYYYVLFMVLAAALSAVSGPVIKRISAYRSFKLPTGSMTPTLLPGDHIIVDLKAYENGKPQRGDIIVFRYPKDPSKDFIKRVVAVGGDEIESRGKVVSVNGKPEDAPYVMFDEAMKPQDTGPGDNFGPIRVPRDNYFVLGDFRDASYDSRYWGFVDEEEIWGKALYIYWSWDAKKHAVRFDRMGKQVEH